jgi:exonuclease SbcC
VQVFYQDYEENFSQEKLFHIEQLIKLKYGCEVVKAYWKDLEKEQLTIEGESTDLSEDEDFHALFDQFLESGEFDLSDEEKNEILGFAIDVDKTLNITASRSKSSLYEICEIEVSNIYSFPAKPTKVSFENMQGIVGVFGSNYSGKSNLFKAIVWGLFQKIVGNVSPQFLVNIYTKSNKGYCKIKLKIDDVTYRITREVTKGKTGNTYSTHFEVQEKLDDGTYAWSDKISDNDTADANEVKRMILHAIGDYDDFAKISMHAQNEKDGYLALDQQEKNDLIARYLNLQQYRDRHEYVKKLFNDLKNKQKSLGKAFEIEDQVRLEKANLDEISRNRKSLQEQESLLNRKIDDINEKINEANLAIIPIKEISETKQDLLNKISFHLKRKETLNEEMSLINKWLLENPKKEIRIESNKSKQSLVTESNKIGTEITSITRFVEEKRKWIEDNPVKEVPKYDISKLRERYTQLSLELDKLDHQLKIARGEKCPTCSQFVKAPNPELEVNLTKERDELQNKLRKGKAIIEEIETSNKHNQLVNNLLDQIKLKESSIPDKNDVLKSIFKQILDYEGLEDTMKHNDLVARSSKKSQDIGSDLLRIESEIAAIQRLVDDYENNHNIARNNKELNENISSYNEMLKNVKMSLYSNKNRLNELTSSIAVSERFIKDKEMVLREINDFDRIYKKYSIYLQSVDRSGIPSLVIQSKLPIINNKVNSILQSVVSFRVDFVIDAKGNINETFYNTESKWDALPLSVASGAQQFIVSIAIKDALNYVSSRSVVQPSLIMIDEGFGTLDDDLRGEVMNMLSYLRSKYKNVLIITHLQEVKEGADHIIEVTRDRSSISKEFIDRDEKAGITELSVKR